MNWFWTGLYHAAAMFWETLWALVFGFALSGVLQVFVSKEQMSRWFGRADLRSLALATALGAASSSCSYAAAAAARSAFKQGAALIPVLAFMFASTNLVVELGAVLWLVLGPTFVAAEVVGALLLVGLVWVLGRWLLPRWVEQAARQHVEGAAADEHGGCGHDHGHDHPAHHDHAGGAADAGRRLAGVANAFVMDWSMLWKELAVGFLIAGFLATLVPSEGWRSLFLQGGPVWLRTIENVLVGVLVAVASFVCSVGNIPLASVLWSGGISFGGVISFIYADLIVVPLVLIYRKYYGTGPAWRIIVLMALSMILAGLAVDGLFTVLHLVPTGPRAASFVEHARFAWNYTTWLNLGALGLGAGLLLLHRRGLRDEGRKTAGNARGPHGHGQRDSLT